MKFSNFIYILQPNKKIRKLAGSALIIGFFAFSILLLSGGMMGMSQGSMTHCPYMQDGQAMCPMTLADHIRSWVQIFSAVVPEGLSMFLLTFFLVVIARSLIYHGVLWDVWKLKLFRNQFNSPEVSVFVHLRRIFRQGILHPKIYPVTI